MLALNNNQPARPDIVYYASELIARLISKNILLQRDCKNVLKVSSAILKLEDNDDIDKKIDEALETLQRAGFGNIGNEILRLITRKLSTPPDADNTDTSGENEESPEANQGSAAAAVDAADPASKKKRVEGTFDVDRSFGSNLDTAAKLELIRRIQEQIAGKGVHTFTGSLRNFYYSIFCPIKNCLKDHCGDDGEFIRKWGTKFAHTSFKTICCSGVGEKCNVIRRQ